MKFSRSNRVGGSVRSDRRTQVNVPALQKIMLDFARENERSELTGELIGDTLDDALADDGDAEAEDKIVSQVRKRHVAFMELQNNLLTVFDRS